MYGSSCNSLFVGPISLLFFFHPFLCIPSCIRDAKNWKRKQRSPKEAEKDIITWTAVHRNSKIWNCSTRLRLNYALQSQSCEFPVSRSCRNVKEWFVNSFSLSYCHYFIDLLFIILYTLFQLWSCWHHWTINTLKEKNGRRMSVPTTFFICIHSA